MSTSSISSSTLSGTSRITGLASGLDVDSIVESTIAAEKTKLNKLQQEEQLAEWKQEAYRGAIEKIKSFTDEYFTTTSENSLIKAGNYLTFSAESDNSAIAALAGSTASAENHSITVSQLATSASYQTENSLTKNIQGNEEIDFASAQGKSFILEIDGSQKTITLSSEVTDIENLQEAIDEEVGEGKIVVSKDKTTRTEVLVFSVVEDSGVHNVSISDASTNGALSDLGFGDGSILQNRISTSDTLDTISNHMNTAIEFNEEGQIALSINGVDFTFDKDDTIAEVMEEINESEAGVILKYDDIQDKLILSTTTTGAGNTLEVSEEGSNFLTAALGEEIEGKDAKLVIDGAAYTRSSNTVTVDGVSYTLKGTITDAATVSIERDVDAIYDNIVSFVEDYNTLISSLNSMISEEYDSDYPPLTDEQKEEMTTEEIEKWESMASTGILENDSYITKLLDRMRAALIKAVPGTSTSLATIGITTGTYDENGKLYIDENTLKQAIQDDPEEIMDLFTKQSTSYSGTTIVRTLDSSERQVRYAEEGIGLKIYDILQDYVSTIRDNNGYKGLLLEKAGMEGDLTNTQNTLTEEMDDLLDAIDEEQERLDDLAENLYSKYATLETYINTMNTQLNTLLSYTSSES